MKSYFLCVYLQHWWASETQSRDLPLTPVGGLFGGPPLHTVLPWCSQYPKDMTGKFYRYLLVSGVVERARAWYDCEVLPSLLRSPEWDLQPGSALMDAGGFRFEVERSSGPPPRAASPRRGRRGARPGPGGRPSPPRHLRPPSTSSGSSVSTATTNGTPPPVGPNKDRLRRRQNSGTGKENAKL